ncbi:MAG TPA: isoaspartyl peptidase/L-asparaginase, partial [Candidatus Manganitrophaceae bacterium]
MRKRAQPSGLILVHGGCGGSKPAPPQLETIRKSIEKGYALLEKGAPAIDAVEAAVTVLEKSGRFNAGRGSRRQMDGIPRMDASLMNGRDLSAGAVAAIENILTPIRAARLVMEKTPHLLLVGESAARLARLHGVETFSPASKRRGGRKIPVPEKWSDLFDRLSEMGTVGAVARDLIGDVAAGTSTG